MKTSFYYAGIALISYFILFLDGIARGSIYVDSILTLANNNPQQLIPPITVTALTLASILTSLHKQIQIYIVGILLLIYGLLFLGTFEDPNLIPFSGISLVATIAFFAKSPGFDRINSAKLGSFLFIIIAMFLLGSSLRIASGPPQYSLAFGSIYDDVRLGGVPLLYTGGVVIYTHLFVLSLSVPIVILFSTLSVVLTENYYLIFRLLRRDGSRGVRKTMSSALTVLSCQCEGITAYFPAAIATILFTAIVPLITESIIFILLTDIMLTLFYLKGKRIRILDRLWSVTSTRKFAASMILSLLLIPVYTVVVVFLKLQENLLVFSSVNVLMFVYGIFAVYMIDSVVPLKRGLAYHWTLLLVGISSAGMLVWYLPQIAAQAVTNPAVFSAMSIVTVSSGVLAGLVFRKRENPVKRLFFEYITMMFSMLAIVVFYITAIPTMVIWPIFGIKQQLEFSLILWGITLPIMWLSTNISLNADGPSVTVKG